MENNNYTNGGKPDPGSQSEKIKGADGYSPSQSGPEDGRDQNITPDSNSYDPNNDPARRYDNHNAETRRTTHSDANAGSGTANNSTPQNQSSASKGSIESGTNPDRYAPASYGRPEDGLNPDSSHNGDEELRTPGL